MPEFKNGDAVYNTYLRETAKYLAPNPDVPGTEYVKLPEGDIELWTAAYLAPAPRTKEDIIQEAVEDYSDAFWHCWGSFRVRGIEEAKQLLAALLEAAIEEAQQCV